MRFKNPSAGIDVPNLAKVGVEGSNPFARSNFLQTNQRVRTVLRDRFLLPGKQGGSRLRRKAADSRSGSASFDRQRPAEMRHDGSGRAPRQTTALDTSVRPKRWASLSINSLIVVSARRPSRRISSTADHGSEVPHEGVCGRPRAWRSSLARRDARCWEFGNSPASLKEQSDAGAG